jgi:bifunctional enzyme CysN/CysC
MAELPLLRVVTCGSVDDGKSTLIGRLLADGGMVRDDLRSALADDSRGQGTQGGEIDYALLADGLMAEREQGITIDVAHLYFSTSRRSFIVTDSPGHEQYTRNMATAASRADLAVILVDASKGVLTQTRRHSLIARLLGVRKVILAVNKMDIVDHSETAFEAVSKHYAEFATASGIEFDAIPLSALKGDNIVERSTGMTWYRGPTLLQALEGSLIDEDGPSGCFRMPVQIVVRPDATFRGFAGMIVSGAVKPGDEITILPSGRTTPVARIVTMDGDLELAEAGQSVTLTLADELDCARGDVICSGDLPDVADQFEASLVWMSETPLVPGRHYMLRIGADSVLASIAPPKYRLDVDTGEHLATRGLALNDIGVGIVTTIRPIVFEPYEENRALGGFILVDRDSNATVAAGMIRFGLRRAANVAWQALDVTPVSRAEALGQRPRLVWFTGLSGAGKSTIANLVEKKLHALGRHTFLLDGDNLRHGLNRDLGFTETDRIENIRRAGEVAKLMADAGLIVLAAFISPFRAERVLVREMFPPGDFIEVHVDVPLSEAERRDPKGLYRKARAGGLPNFTGIDSPYEAPERPELLIDAGALSPEEAADRVVALLE